MYDMRDVNVALSNLELALAVNLEKHANAGLAQMKTSAEKVYPNRH